MKVNLESLLDELKLGVEFTKGQAPIVTEQLIKYTLLVDLSLIFGIIGLNVTVYYFLVTSIFALCAVISSVILLILLYEVFKLIWFPNLFVFEYIESRINKN